MFMMNQYIVNTCSVQCTVYSVQCTACSVQSTVYNVHCTVPCLLNIGCLQGKSDWCQLAKRLGGPQRILPRAGNRSTFFWSITFHSAAGVDMCFKFLFPVNEVQWSKQSSRKLTPLFQIRLQKYAIPIFLHSFLMYSLTPCSRFLVGKIVVSQLLIKFPVFCGTRGFIFVFTRASDFSLSWARWIQSTLSHPICLRYILILSWHYFVPNFFFRTGCSYSKQTSESRCDVWSLNVKEKIGFVFNNSAACELNIRMGKMA
jgi:hypothetical protein